ncbi:twin-arginine translocase TatA/TatE family subunit [Rossellomorea vietnamensis]|jgi:sec-independent protein translocase protein TatA|uniref:Sec-independent protein translocase protein TatA n=1 Tax=Rossellomorea vietnamensis TaxID=218284 RepID=A0A6I6UFE1_9BACI|nr:twin-arginine translocase TatA/TatE family subunit [Rossellomorea vietnamensis]OXS56774.1 Sec-independent protein translocase TatA [Bacillus sp. DSM 27956]PRX73315.1 sec-independent protein translocase protein TatA [Bacillus sp. V-88]QHE61585.1 twin-arginine translocase TatA/TatE family subunit [Rossellomorea vietnamensis]SLK24180.1 sec-independent protein translocase protein TatA [Bacillus sp. V-88]
MNLGFGEIAIILFVALLFFGPSKLPELGKAAGATLKEFKKAVSGIMEDEEQQNQPPSNQEDKNNHM